MKAIYDTSRLTGMGPTGKVHYASRGRGPGQWHPSVISATFYCPGCGKPHSLHEFKIDAAGGVTPSVVCSYHERDKCFHDSVVLVGWQPT